MEVVKVQPDAVFLLEVEKGISEKEKEAILLAWNGIIPNKLIIVPKGTLKMLEVGK